VRNGVAQHCETTLSGFRSGASGIGVPKRELGNQKVRELGNQKVRELGNQKVRGRANQKLRDHQEPITDD
jgi:hypothetical protein